MGKVIHHGSKDYGHYLYLEKHNTYGWIEYNDMCVRSAYETHGKATLMVYKEVGSKQMVAEQTEASKFSPKKTAEKPATGCRTDVDRHSDSGVSRTGNKLINSE